MNFIKYEDIEGIYLDGRLIVENQEIGTFQSRKEALEFCEGLHLSNFLKQERTEEDHDVDTQSIAMFLKENSDYKVSEYLVECFKTFINNKAFVPSNALLKLREQYNDCKFDSLIEYVLSDGSKVLLHTDINKKLNNIITLERLDVIKHMTKNRQQFVNTVHKLLG